MKYVFRASLVLLLVFAVSACGLGAPSDVRIVNKIRVATATKLRNEKDLCLIGTGAQMMYEIEMLAMSFNYYKEVDIGYARELVVYATETYLDAINSNKKIKPYLADDPFTARNIQIMLFVYGPDRRELPPEKLGYILVSRGKIRYYDRSIDYRNPIYQETYEEALSKVKM